MDRRDWDGAAYDKVSGVVAAMGEEVLRRLELGEEQLVLDGGCGSGRVTELLAARVPDGLVYAVDADESMLAAASARLADLPNVELLRADLTTLRLPRRVDAIFSTAVFHWIDDHDRLFRNLRSLLARDGRLCAQCGGEGNVAFVHAAAAQVSALPRFRRFLFGFEPPVNFASVDDTVRHLRVAGFSSLDCWLEQKPVSPDRPRLFLGTVILGAQLSHLPESLRDDYLSEVLDRLPDPLVVDYVRLNIDAQL